MVLVILVVIVEAMVFVNRGGSHGGHAGCKFCGSSHGNGRPSSGNGDGICCHYGISNHTKSYYWVKHDKPNYMHQVINGKTHNLFYSIWACN